MAINLQSVTSLVNNNGVKLLIYGGSGAGKTRLISTAPSPIVISSESGLLSLAKVCRELGLQIPAITIKSYEDLHEAYTFCSQDPKMQHFKTVCLDSISDISETVLSAMKKKCKDPRQAYGEMQDKVVTIIKLFRDLPNKHVYFASKEEKDQAGKSTPSLPGKNLTNGISYYFDEVFRLVPVADLETKETVRWFATENNELTHVAKDRSGMLDAWEPANITHVIKKIQSA